MIFLPMKLSSASISSESTMFLIRSSPVLIRRGLRQIAIRNSSLATVFRLFGIASTLKMKHLECHVSFERDYDPIILLCLLDNNKIHTCS